MPGDRPHDVAGMTCAELDRARRDLQVSLVLAFLAPPSERRSWAASAPSMRRWPSASARPA
jgi:hypothetical protein